MVNKFESLGIEHLYEIVKNATSFADIIRAFDYSVSSGGYETLKKTLDKHSVDYSHIKTGLDSNKGRSFGMRVPIDDFLTNIENKSFSGNNIKKRLFKEKLLYPICALCGIGQEWNGMELRHHLDHINGKHDDNRIENLRVLCPNCHSQTPTYSGRNKKQNYYCVDCGISVSCKVSKRCKNCSPANVGLKCIKFNISKEELEKLVWEKPTAQIAKEFGVSDNAIGKRCKKFGIEKPPRGYWAKNRSI